MKRKHRSEVGSEGIEKLSFGMNFFVNIIYILACIAIIYPLLIVLGTSFTTEEYVKTFGYTAFPKQLNFDAYAYLFKNSATIMRAYAVTIITTVAGTALSVLVNALYGYAVSRREFRFRRFFIFLQFFTMLFSGGLVPWYLVCVKLLHLKNTYLSLVLPMINSAWNMIILKTFFTTSVPGAIVESARIDGASEFKTFFGIVWPIAVPGLATIALFAMLGLWNQYYNPMILTTEPKYQTIQLYLYNILKNLSMISEGKDLSLSRLGQMKKELPRESARMALCVIAVGPIVLAYPFFQKYFIKGLTIGSVKG